MNGFTRPHVFQMGRVRPTSWYPPGESMGYMHMYAPPSPTVPSSVNVLAGLYLGTTSRCLHASDQVCIDLLHVSSVSSGPTPSFEALCGMRQAVQF